MASDTTSELAAFVQFLTARLGSGANELSPEEALDLWRSAHPEPNQYAEDAAAIRAALKDMEAGDLGLPLSDFDGEFRQRHNLPPRA
jgi:hypothetical protein